jgi:small GTP-binding protein
MAAPPAGNHSPSALDATVAGLQIDKSASLSSSSPTLPRSSASAAAVHIPPPRRVQHSDTEPTAQTPARTALSPSALSSSSSRQGAVFPAADGPGACSPSALSASARSSRVSQAKPHRTRFLPTYKVLMLGDTAVGKSNLLSRFTCGTFDATSRTTIGMEFVSREVDLSCGASTMAGNFGGDQPDNSAAVTPTTPQPASSPRSRRNSPSHPQHEAALIQLAVSPPAVSLLGNGLLDASSPTPPRDGRDRRGSAVSDTSQPMNLSSSGHGQAADRVVLQLWDTAGQEACAALSHVYYRGARGAVVVYDVTRRSTLLNVGRWVASARQHCDTECVIVVIGNKTDLQHGMEVTEDDALSFCHSLDCRHYYASAMNGEGVEFAFMQLLLSIHAESLVRNVANQLPGHASSSSASLATASQSCLRRMVRRSTWI